MDRLQNKVSFAGLLIALGIIYGDIGTSPLYVLNAIMSTYSYFRRISVGCTFPGNMDPYTSNHFKICYTHPACR